MDVSEIEAIVATAVGKAMAAQARQAGLRRHGSRHHDRRGTNEVRCRTGPAMA